MNTDNINPVRTDVVIGAGFTSVVVTVTVEDGTDAVKTSRRHVQMNIKNSSPNYVIHMMMLQTIRHYVNLVRTDVVIGVLIVINVVVTVNVESGTIAVKTSR